MGLEHLQVFIAHPDAIPRIEAAVARVGGSAQQSCIAVVHSIRARQVQLQLIHSLEVPFGGARSPVDFERHFALGPEDCTARLKAALHAILKFDQRANIVFVFHFAGRVAFLAHRKMRALSGHGQRTLADEDVPAADKPLDRSNKHVGHVCRVGHDIPQDTQPGLLSLEAPRQHAQGVAAVHCKEAAPVVGQAAQLAGLD